MIQRNADIEKRVMWRETITMRIIIAIKGGTEEEEKKKASSLSF
jgi:hypothetical protein